MKSIFKQIILERQQWMQSLTLIKRQLKIEKHANYVFTGLRRAGKTFMLYQIAKEIIERDNYEEILFINFEDERLIGVTHLELNQLIEAYNELFNHQPIIFLDEIQNIDYWYKFARRLADEGYRVYITGSNAEMLGNEIASTLGGRFINKEILPLSFAEFLDFKEVKYSYKSLYNKERYSLIKEYESYFAFGGFPELIHLSDKREYLSNVYQKLFYGDLIARYKISNVHLLRFLVKKIAESVNNETSVNRIKNLISSTGLSIGSNTLFDYLAYLESAFMIATLSNFTSKFVERETSKKYYFMDCGILTLFLFNQETKLLENQIYIELRRRGYEIYFFKRKTEVDFYVPEKELLIQVSYSINDIETKIREVRALTDAMKELSINEGLIITKNESEEIETKYGKIKVLPAWQWLLALEG